MEIIIGLDVHKDTIAAAAIDLTGAVVDQAEFDNTPAGIDELAGWSARGGDQAPDRSHVEQQPRLTR